MAVPFRPSLPRNALQVEAEGWASRPVCGGAALKHGVQRPHGCTSLEAVVGFFKDTETCRGGDLRSHLIQRVAQWGARHRVGSALPRFPGRGSSEVCSLGDLCLCAEMKGVCTRS